MKKVYKLSCRILYRKNNKERKRWRPARRQHDYTSVVGRPNALRPHWHSAGDEVLREVADRLRVTLRDRDVLGRYGGEEFVVYLDHLTSIDAAVAVAERLRHVIEESPVETAKGPITATISAGIAAMGVGIDTVEALVAAADRAMYLAKNSGRNRIVLATAARDTTTT